MTRTISYYMLSGGIQFLLGFLLPLFIYVLAKPLFLLGSHFIGKTPNAWKKAKNIARAGVKLFAILLLFFLIAGALVQKITHTRDPAKIAQINDFYMRSDKAIFGEYLPFWLQSRESPQKTFFDKATAPIVWAYGYLALAMGLFCLFTLFLNPKALSRITAAFMLSMAISLPFWFLFPALSPEEAYKKNVLGARLPTDLEDSLTSYSPNEKLAALLAYFEKRGESGRDHYYAVTTMPSMHIAWATIMLYFGFLLLPASLLFLIPYYLLNMAGTVLLLQHYAVDIFGGIAVAAIAIYFSKKISQLFSSTTLEILHESIKEDLTNLRIFLGTLVKFSK